MNRFTLSLTTLALALGLAACSGDDGGSGTTTNTTNTTNNTTTSTTASSSTTEESSSSSSSSSGSTTDAPTTDPSTTTPETTGSTTDPSTTDATTSDTTTGGSEPDKNWPPLNPQNPNMPCPDGYEAASFVQGGAVCAPKCSGPGKVCPSGETGNAKGVCAFNPDSSGMTCMMGDTCTDMTEMCQQTGGGGYACLKPVSHCVLLCNGGEKCPDGMECMGNLVCQYKI